MTLFTAKIRAAAAAVLVLAVPTAAQQAETTPQGDPNRVVNGQVFDEWRVACQAIAVNETACGLVQTLTNTANNSLLIEFQAVWTGGEAPVQVVARVPVGAHLPSGLSIGSEGAEERQNFVWQTCGPRLCEASLTAPLTSLQALEGETPVVIGYRPAPRAEALVFRSTFTGLSAGLTALDRAQSGG